MLFPVWLFSSVFTVFPAGASEKKPPSTTFAQDLTRLHEEIFAPALLHVLLLAQTASVFFSRLVGSQKQPQVIYGGSKRREDPGAGGRGPERRGMRGLSRNAAPPRQEWLQPQELTPLLFTSHLNVLEVFYSQLRQLHSRLDKATRRFRRRRSNDLFHLIKQQVGEEPAEK